MKISHRRHHHREQHDDESTCCRHLASEDISLTLSESCSFGQNGDHHPHSHHHQHSRHASYASSRNHQHHTHRHDFHLSKTYVMLFVALFFGSLVIPVSISFSQIFLSDDEMFQQNGKVSLITQQTQRLTSTTRQQQQQQEAFLFSKPNYHHLLHNPLTNNQHHRIVFLEAPYLHRRPVPVEPMSALNECYYCHVEADHHRLEFEKRFYEDCVPIQQWQSKSFPTCNILHQIDMQPQLVRVQASNSSRLLNATNVTNNATTATTRNTTIPLFSPSLLSTQGSWRTVWTLHDSALPISQQEEAPTILVAKFLEFTTRNFTHESFGYHNTDALIMEHLTASPYILNAYSYCGQSVITEHADTEIRAFIKRKDFGSRARLQLARDLAGALAVLHYRDDIMASNSGTRLTSTNTTSASRRQQQGHAGPLRATIAHNDLNIANVMVVNHTIKLNDFNIAILLRQKRHVAAVNNMVGRNESSSEFESCGAPVIFANDMWKSPEDVANQTYTDPAASDVYSMGNLLFHVLTRRMPWGALEPEFSNHSMTNATSKRPPRLSKHEVRERKLQALGLGNISSPISSSSLSSSSTPHIPIQFIESKKTAERALVLAIQACYRLDPLSRPTSRELALSLARALQVVDKTKNRHDLLVPNYNNRTGTTILQALFEKDYWTKQHQY